MTYRPCTDCPCETRRTKRLVCCMKRWRDPEDGGKLYDGTAMRELTGNPGLSPLAAIKLYP